MFSNEKCQAHQTDHSVFTLDPPSKLLIKFACLAWKHFETESNLFLTVRHLMYFRHPVKTITLRFNIFFIFPETRKPELEI